MVIYRFEYHKFLISQYKVASSSFFQLMNGIQHSIVTKEELSQLKVSLKLEGFTPVVVVFMRDFKTRIDSAFSHSMHLALNNSGYDAYAPRGTVKAYGGRHKGDVSVNLHHWTDQKRQSYLDKVVQEEGKGSTKSEIITDLNAQDYQSFVDHIILKGKDLLNDHWGSQVQSCTHEGEFLPTIAHELTTDAKLKSDWSLYSEISVPNTNHHTSIDTADYMLAELQALYAQDISFIEDIRSGNGTWNA